MPVVSGSEKAREVSLKFRKMITKRLAEHFDGWLEAASQGGVRELESFARTLRAVTARRW